MKILRPISMEESLWKKVKKAADKLGLSAAGFVRMIIMKYFEEKK